MAVNCFPMYRNILQDENVIQNIIKEKQNNDYHIEIQGHTVKR